MHVVTTRHGEHMHIRDLTLLDMHPSLTSASCPLDLDMWSGDEEMHVEQSRNASAAI